MDLSLLRDSLPPRNVAQEDKDLLNDFRAAALSVTTLYKSSLRNSKKAYNEGYATCLRDVLNFIQAGVSAEGRMTELGGNDGSGALGLNLNFDVDGKGMTIGRVMDWVEGRLEMITSEEEEDPSGNAGGPAQDEEEQRPAAKAKPAKETAKRMSSARTKQAQSGGLAQEAAVVVQPPPPPAQATTTTVATAPAFDRSSPPPSLDAYRHPTAIPPSSSPASVRTSSYPSSQGALTRSRSRASVSEKQIRRFAAPALAAPAPAQPQQQDPLTSDFTFAMPHSHHHHSDLSAVASTGHAAALRSSDFFDLGNISGNSDVTSAALPTSTQSVLGSKRRHAAMVSEITNTQAGANSAAATSPTSPGGRRRRISTTGASRSLVMNGDDMDIEDEPARKRVARR
ncbi:hypothetical protein FRC00_001087 [Tulasnella sp. 408]|nr:hypothetical protein FRC00_001087 [Tulasnella sp. 408]